MAATLTGNKAKLASTLASQNPMINTDVMRQYNPTYNPNQGAGVSGVMGTGNTAGTEGTQTSTYNPLTSEASQINSASKVAGQNLLDGMSGKIGGSTASSTIPSQQAPAEAPAQPSVYETQRNQAFDEYGAAILPDTQTRSQIDTARNDLMKTYEGQTIEQAYNQQREQRGVADTESRLNQTNQLIRTNQEGARNAQEQNFSSSGGVTDAGVQQLRAYNSRDFIRNLSDLSNVRANTVDELNMKNGQIDTILKLRQQDRAQTQQNLKDKIEMLSNKITPAEKELLKAKLDSKINSINTREQAEVDRIKKANEYQMQRDYTLGDINSTDPIKKRVAIENAVNEIRKQYEGMPFVRSSSSMADDIQKLVSSGMSLSDAIKQNIVDPLQSKAEYKDFMAKRMGTQDKYDYKPIQKADANGNLITTGYMAVNKLDPTDYKLLGVDANGMPATGGGGAPTSVGNTPTNTIDYIKSKEGFRDQAYDDATGKPVPPGQKPKGTMTIGYGFTTRADGSPVQPGDTMDQQTADQMLQTKVGQYQNFANKIKVPLTEAQKTALTSFEYNLGKNIWDGTAKPIIDKINAGDFAGAAEYMKKFNTVKGTVVNGLTNRRNEEASLLMQTAPSTGIEVSTAMNIAFDPNKSDVYINALAGKFEGMKPGSDNAKKLLSEAQAWKQDIRKNALAGNYTEGQISLMGEIPSINAQTKKTLDENGLTEQDWAKFQNGLLPPTEKQKKTAQTIIDDANALLAHPGFSPAVGVSIFQPGFTIPGTDKADFQAKFDNFISQLTLPNLGQLKGPMSDKDVDFLKRSASSLSLSESEAQFAEDLGNIVKKYQEIINKGVAGNKPDLTIAPN